MEDKAAALLAASIIVLVLTWIAVPLRCYARLKVISRLAVEDWTMIASQLLFTVGVVGVFEQLYSGFGNHEYQITPSSLTRGLFWLFIDTIVYTINMALLRISIGLLLLRLMTNRVQRFIIYAVWFLSISTSILMVIWTFTTCKPMSKYWNKFQPGTCRGNNYASSYVQSAVNILCDWTLAILPMWPLYKSKLPRQTKIFTAGILGVGALASISSAVRLYELRQVEQHKLSDFAYRIVNVLITSALEQSLCILAGCFATYRPLFAKMTRSTAAQTDDGTRGRRGRPPQPGDTKIDWDPGLTIGYIGQIAEGEEEGFGEFGLDKSATRSTGETRKGTETREAREATETRDAREVTETRETRGTRGTGARRSDRRGSGGRSDSRVPLRREKMEVEVSVIEKT